MIFIPVNPNYDFNLGRMYFENMPLKMSKVVGDPHWGCHWHFSDEFQTYMRQSEQIIGKYTPLMGVLYGGLRACRCERPNVSPSLGTDKKFCWPVDSSYLEAHHLLYLISPLDTKS